MRTKTGPNGSADKHVKEIKRKTRRLGVAIEMAIEAIGECVEDGNEEIEMGYFADAYAFRNDCDEELNPFVSENWSTIDTGKALQRYQAETQQRRRRAKTS